MQGPNYIKFADNIGVHNDRVLQQSMMVLAMDIIGSFDDIVAVSDTFFSGTHQRITVLSKRRFMENLRSSTLTSKLDLMTLCLSIRLIQQMPQGPEFDMQGPLYRLVKNFLEILEGSNNLSLDLMHSRLLATFYEIGHGLHTAAYISVAVCARVGRALELHRKLGQQAEKVSSLLRLEEERRIWWAIIVMD